ncbi:hypothetical protein AJ80_05502 [Polytolypa hystricis UAMH7299]|uniref:YAG7-like dimerisation domain-containing protein n=1 Tax=Polytolypa hystricis (strain UAMH7299) TaxID=1447883 RepID=A0A2B7Y2R5_POLH7|nr:hypothetical protein AJ80_05502 [Polytolypa hystricis UAMH7299]
MSSSPVANIPPQAESKTAKKKRAKSEATSTAATETPNPGTPTISEAVTNGHGAHEPAFMKDLQKALRNTVKKLNASAKVDAIVAENSDKSLDDLITEKKINADQKAQILKKPGLQATVAQIEEQLSQFKQYGAYYEAKLASQKAELEKAHRDELDATKEKAVAETKEATEKDFGERLLVLSRFLRAAAAMRRSGDETSSDSRAFEGVLFQVYGGTEEAVAGMLKLINGAEDKIPSVDAQPLDVLYSRVKQASLDYIPPATEGWTDETEQAKPTPAAESVPVSDPTLTNAGLTELQEPSMVAQAAATNGYRSSPPPQKEEHVAPPSQTAVNDTAANESGQSAWDNQASASFSTSATAEDWVEVEKVPEPEPALEAAAAPAAPTPQQHDGSWAEEAPAKAAETPVAQSDGFEQVVHHARQNSGRGRGFRSRGGPRGDGFRGRGGFRGDYRGRGRGRGDYRGGRGRGGYAPQGGQAPPVGGEGPRHH